ncbi:LOW QUALITY PROTEIN: olfactory receptor 2D2-like [Cuculus canorus]|uniref:LOW QUALITY PROTEIN: olfactory receptor 2D2-like n=1 Tax=Cuculus canorus TaxID=55661 RepID=UPI0023AA7881|nr:LOW QUALITY PROTEIN: olfactory receptor 2D2-like [Cuculus canorus]
MARENQSIVTQFVFQGLSSQPRTQTILFVAFLFFYLFTVVGNITIIAVIRADCQLQSPMYFFLANLDFLDICFVSSNIPQMLVNLLTRKRTISFSGCAAQMCFSLAFGMTERVLLGVMAYDRYMAICHPLLYTTIISRKVCIHMVMASWITSLLSSMVINSLNLRLPFCGPDILNHFFCKAPAVLALACADTAFTELVIFIFSILIVFIPFLLIITSYAHILSAALKIQSVHVQSKVFSTCGSHLMVVTIFFGTAICIYVNPKSRAPQDRDKVISMFYTIVAAMLNPLIYSLRNMDMQRALRRAMNRSKSFFI